MSKNMITPKDWEELFPILRKLQIGYETIFDAHGERLEEMVIVMNPIGIEYPKHNDNVVIAEGAPKAKWEYDKKVGSYACSNCNEFCSDWEGGDGTTVHYLNRFCGNCGAEMENWD